MPKIDVDSIAWKGGTGYPPPFDQLVEGRHRKRLGDALGLTQFGVNLTRLEPGAASAQRHWHENEDEFVYVLSGQAMLVEDEGETILGPGDAAAFKAGVANGHHLINRSEEPVFYLEVGTRASDEKAHYPDIDLFATKRDYEWKFTRKDGSGQG